MKTPEQGMGSTSMDSMVKMLASATEQQRREMIRTRLSAFAQANDADRINGMKMMVQAINKLDRKSAEKLAYTRLESLAEDFDATTRKKLMKTHMNIVADLPENQMAVELRTMVSVMGQCHEECKMKNMSTLKELMSEMPQDRKDMIVQQLPADTKKMLMG